MPQDEADDDLDDGIDWADLQSFFYEDLETKMADLEMGLGEGDCTKLFRIGHSIKGSGGGVKLPIYTELGKHLETAGKANDLEASRTACAAIRDEYLKSHPDRAEKYSTYFRKPGEELKRASGF